MQVEKEFTVKDAIRRRSNEERQFFSFISSSMGPRCRRIKRISLEGTRARILFARLINDRRAYQHLGILAARSQFDLAASRFNQAFHYARHSEQNAWLIDRWYVEGDAIF